MESSITSERDEAVKNIRPSVEDSDPGATEEEQFENLTIRPILKLQNSIIIAQFRMYTHKFKPSFNAYNQSIQRNFIEDVMRSDPRIKNSLIASLISLMTLDEYNYYCSNKTAVNKRIISLLVKRLQSMIEYLY